VVYYHAELVFVKYAGFIYLLKRVYNKTACAVLAKAKINLADRNVARLYNPACVPA
jgi:hypothetical protein